MNRSGGTTMKIKTAFRRAVAATSLLLALTTATFGQGRLSRTNVPPHEGFWVVESQPKKNCTVYFYNDANQLIYQEVLTKKQLNIKRPATQESLNAVLKQALQQWSLGQKTGHEAVPANQQWLAAEFTH
ncbi:hypothetical protein ACFPMF_09935 [Larkinella bovis]|uniref:DUF4907 domain-containing protein n=1 Tax=Larkinella bovis TaxID=683041 RepID=A0ABW0IAB1_9BACT